MSKLAHLAINAEGFAFDPMTGDSYQVSGTGLAVLEALVAGKGDEEVAQSLAETYEVTLETARRDLADFRGQLKRHGLV